MRRIAMMLSIALVAYTAACSQAEAKGENVICGIVDSVSRDTMTLIKNMEPYEVQVIHFSDGRQIRTLDTPSTQLAKGGSYLFPTYGRQVSDGQKAFYRLADKTVRIPSCDSIPPRDTTKK